MQKVIFKIDKQKDIWNIWDKTNHSSQFRTPIIADNIKKLCTGKKLRDCRKELANHLSPIYSSGLLEIDRGSVEEGWRKIEKEFFKRMDKLFGKKINESITAYQTTLGVCPYNPDENWFMFSFFYSLPYALSTCGHEIMHLYFHKYFWKDTAQKIGEKKTADLKEALTVLLNLEFRDLWFSEDKGYSQHKDLRNFISKTWQKDKNFPRLLDACTDYLS